MSGTKVSYLCKSPKFNKILPTQKEHTSGISVLCIANPIMAMSKAKKLGLPEDILIDIVFRLPVKSIGIFRCVSKHWRNFLSDPQFIHAHLTIHGEKEGEQKLIVANVSLHTITLTQTPHDEKIGVISEELNIFPFREWWISVDGSCNGLVLVVNPANEKYLINPTTLKYHKIAEFDLALPEEESKCVYGFGYDVVSDDYKVVTLSFCDTDEPDTDDTFVDIYSVRKGLWRRLESSPYDYSRAKEASGVLVNGNLHWLTSKKSDYSRVIAAFNLSDEKFFEVPLPNKEWGYFDSELVALRGRLCLFTNLGVHTVVLCLMKEYGVKESWSIFRKVPSLPSLQDIICTPLCSMTDDDIVMDAEYKLMLYNMKENQLQDPCIDASLLMNKARTFIDSLVSPSYGNGAEG